MSTRDSTKIDRHRAARRDLRRPGQRPADPPGRRGPARRRPPGHALHQDPRRGLAVAAASRTGRRAPAAPVRARSARRSSPAVASCTARSRATTTSAPQEDEGRRPALAPSPTGPATAASTSSCRPRRHRRSLHQDRGRPRWRPSVYDRGAIVLVVAQRGDELTWQSLRNAPTVHLLVPDQLNTYDVLVSDDVVFTRARSRRSSPAAGGKPPSGRARTRGRGRARSRPRPGGQRSASPRPRRRPRGRRKPRRRRAQADKAGRTAKSRRRRGGG